MYLNLSILSAFPGALLKLVRKLVQTEADSIDLFEVNLLNLFCKLARFIITNIFLIFLKWCSLQKSE
jgi:hypothetical protein